MINSVIVTALYDIDRENWANFRMSNHTYCWWMRNTLSIDNNIVIYTEDKFVNDITKYRMEFDPDLSKTKIITNNVTDLESYKRYFKDLYKLMNSHEFTSKVSFPDVPEMSKPLYNIIMFNKVFFLKDAIDNDYFNNDVVIWADAGGLREDVSNYAKSIWPNLSKVNDVLDKFIFFSHNSDFDVISKEFHSLSQIRNIQGTCFIVPSEKIDIMIEHFDNIVKDSINSGYIGSDEKIFDIYYSDNKSMFNLIKSSWREYFDILK